MYGANMKIGFVHFNSSTNECTITLHKALLNHFKTLRHVSILSDHHQGALFLAKVILRYSHSILICKRSVVAVYHVVWECVVEQWLGVRRTRTRSKHVGVFESVLKVFYVKLLCICWLMN